MTDYFVAIAAPSVAILTSRGSVRAFRLAVGSHIYPRSIPRLFLGFHLGLDEVKVFYGVVKARMFVYLAMTTESHGQGYKQQSNSHHILFLPNIIPLGA